MFYLIIFTALPLLARTIYTPPLRACALSTVSPWLACAVIASLPEMSYTATWQASALIITMLPLLVPALKEGNFTLSTAPS